jgi:hypothetical protein
MIQRFKPFFKVYEALPPAKHAGLVREKQRLILLACFGENGPYARVGPLALTGFADHIGVNQIRNQRCQLAT